MRVVIDTNVLVRAVIRPNGAAGQLFERLRAGEVTYLYSAASQQELVEVLNRPQLTKKYNLSPHYLFALYHQLRRHSELIEPLRQITACRDPKDDKFLELAVAAAADMLVSEDQDLLSMNPFESIPIVTVRQAMALLDQIV